MLVVKCGCGSTVLSPIPTEFKCLVLIFSLTTNQFGDTVWMSVQEMHCVLEAGNFLFLCNLPIRAANLCVLCLCIWTKALSICWVCIGCSHWSQKFIVLGFTRLLGSIALCFLQPYLVIQKMGKILGDSHRLETFYSFMCLFLLNILYIIPIYKNIKQLYNPLEGWKCLERTGCTQDWSL